MKTTVLFLLGMMAGGTLGVIFMCLVQIGRDMVNERRK